MDDLEEIDKSASSWTQKRSFNVFPLRLTYRPAAEHEEVGELERNNALGKAPRIPRFQQLSPSTSWAAASQPSYHPAGRPVDLNRSSQNWLLKTYPEAIVGDEEFTSLLSAEISSSRARYEPSLTGALLAVGEILDARVSGESQGHLVVASASGEFGHILRLAVLEREEWTWSEHSSNADLIIRLKAVDPDGCTDWFEDAEPILSIKFITDIRGDEATRWMVVQKASSTVLLRPEIRRTSAYDEESGIFSRQDPYWIYANPTCSISKEETGGDAHCDVAFNPSSPGDGPEPPQLAIVGQAGNWSVWDLFAAGDAQPMLLNKVRRDYGNAATGLRTSLPPDTEKDSALHRIMWLPPPGTAEAPKPSLDPDLLRAKHPLPLRRAQALVLCSSHALDIVDIGTGRINHAVNLVAPTKTRRILQMQPCPLDSSQFFVLTNKTFSWVGNRPAPNGNPALSPLLSRSHHIDTEQAPLQLSVSLPFLRGDGSLFVSIRAAGASQMMIHRVMPAKPGGLAQCHSQIVSLETAVNPVTTALIPVEWRLKHKRTANELIPLLSQGELTYCQLITLGSDFSVSSSLCAWSDQPNFEVSPPDRIRDEKSKSQSWHSENTFLIPDLDVLDNGSTSLNPQATQMNPDLSQVPAARFISLMFPAAAISQRAEAAVEGRQDDEAIPGSLASNAHDVFNEVQELAEGHGSADALHACHNWGGERPGISISRPGQWNPSIESESIRDIWSDSYNSLGFGGSSMPTIDLISHQLEASRWFLSTTTQDLVSEPSQQSQTFTPVRQSGSRQSTASSQEHAEDPLGARLRRYLPTLKTVTQREGGAALPIAHWNIGGDPDKTKWKDPEGLKQDKETALQRKKREESAQRKLARSTSVLSQRSESAAPSIYALSQPTPSIAFGTQPSPRQPSLANSQFSQPQSQVVAGPFGARRPRSKTPMSTHCHDEHAGEGGHHHHDHEHDHSDDITPALQFSLYPHINFDEVTALNETEFGSGRAIVKKTWAERLSEQPELASDADEQLLINVPFTGQVKLHSIIVRTSNSESAPKTLKVIQNRDDVDFGVAEDAEGTQTFELAQTSDLQELPVKRARFGQVRRLALFFPDNFGDGDEDVTRIAYLGFKGEWMQLGRAPANILYEAAANPGDHKLKGTSVNQMGSGIGGRGPGI
ncbi:DUF1000-domain-containing protein [Thozetella sp. PMI_491]|nr:DUF1000-domain-containing protein [Thozetella sp. PMI_491]